MHEVPGELLCAEWMAMIADHTEPPLLFGDMYSAAEVRTWLSYPHPVFWVRHAFPWVTGSLREHDIA